MKRKNSSYNNFLTELHDVLKFTLPNHQQEKISRIVASKRKETPNPSTKPKPKIIYSGIFCGSSYELKRGDIVAFDFDGTLAQKTVPYDPRKAGPPLGADKPDSAFNLCKELVERGAKVVILTARVNSQQHTKAQLQFTRKLIQGWSKKYLGKVLPITAEKHSQIAVIYDDRAKSVNPETGEIA